MARKSPSFQFYPDDWMKDRALRSVGICARGLWIDMLCLMHENGRRGYLQHATGKPVTHEQLARMTGCSSDDVSRLLQELEDSGVFSRTDQGTVFSRRMVREDQLRERRSIAGKVGGNRTGVLLKQIAKQTVKQTASKPLSKSGPPPPLSPPLPLLTPPQSAEGECCAFTNAATPQTPPADSAVKVKKSRTLKRVRTDAEHNIRREFIRGFCDVWLSETGQVYEFACIDPVTRGIHEQAAWRIMDDPIIGFNLDRAAQMSKFFAKHCACNYPCYPCPLGHLAKHISEWFNKSNLFGNLIGGNHAKPDSYAIPIGRRASAG